MPPETELLVHISAPCGASDDARYRKEAQNCLLFKPANRHSLFCSDVHETAVNAAFDIAPSTAEDNDTEYSNVDLSSFETPGGLTKGLAKIHVARTPIDYRPQTAPSSTTCIKETPFLHRRSQSDSWEQSSSLIPDSQPSRRLAIPFSKRHYDSRSLSPSSLLGSPSAKRRRLIFPVSTCHATEVKPSLPPNDGELDLEISFPSERLRSILAPPPRPSNEPFKTYITSPLALINTHLPLPAFYVSLQAQPPLRELEIHERGHWAFSISAFSAEHKAKVWTYLEKFIGAGRAGRVSCFLEEVRKDVVEKMKKRPSIMPVNEAHEQAQPCEAEGGADTEEFMKVYCMGEAVPSIWLLLFIATTRQVKGRRAQWIDASGMVVVQMH